MDGLVAKNTSPAEQAMMIGAGVLLSPVVIFLGIAMAVACLILFACEVAGIWSFEETLGVGKGADFPIAEWDY